MHERYIEVGGGGRKLFRIIIFLKKDMMISGCSFTKKNAPDYIRDDRDHLE